MHYLYSIPLFLCAVQAGPMPYLINSNNIRSFPCDPRHDSNCHSQPKGLLLSSSEITKHTIRPRKCLQGSMDCPYVADPPENPCTVGTPGCPYTTDQKNPNNPTNAPAQHHKQPTPEKTSPNPQQDEPEKPHPPQKLDPIHDKLILACGTGLQTCQICKYPHKNCAPAIFGLTNQGDPQVCVKDLFCADVPNGFWNSIPEDVD